MFPFDPPQTAEDATAAFTALTDAAWVLAAAVEVIRRGPQERYAPDDPPARVLAAAGLLVPDGAGFVAAPGLAAFMAGTGRARADVAHSVLGQVLAVLRGSNLREGWAQQDDETLLAQGTASGHFLRKLLPMLLARLPELEERLRAPGACFLDVGVGVGAMACVVAETLPNISVVGIDPLERVLELAKRQVAERGLEDRIALRACGVEELTDRDAFDVAWVPAPFVPRSAFMAGLANLYRAIRPGGWIVVGTRPPEGSGVSAEVTRWQGALIGGTPLTLEEARQVLVQAGFVDVVIPEGPPGAPSGVLARRPS